MPDPYKLNPVPLFPPRSPQKTIQFVPAPLWFPLPPSQSLLLRKPPVLTPNSLPGLKTFVLTMDPPFMRPIPPLGLPPQRSAFSLPEGVEAEKENEVGATYSKKDGWQFEGKTSYNFSFNHEWKLGCTDCLYTRHSSLDKLLDRLVVGASIQGGVSSSNAFRDPMASAMEANVIGFSRIAVARNINLTALAAFGSEYSFKDGKVTPQAKFGLELGVELGEGKLALSGSAQYTREDGAWGLSIPMSLTYSVPLRWGGK